MKKKILLPMDVLKHMKHLKRIDKEIKELKQNILIGLYHTRQVRHIIYECGGSCDIIDSEIKSMEKALKGNK